MAVWREDFLDRLVDQMEDEPTENHEPGQARETMTVRASSLVAEELRRLKLTTTDLQMMCKGDPVKVGIAERIHRETPMTLRWIAEALQMASWRHLSFLLYQRRRKYNINKVRPLY